MKDGSWIIIVIIAAIGAFFAYMESLQNDACRKAGGEVVYRQRDSNVCIKPGSVIK